MFQTVKFAYLLCVIFANKSTALFNHESTPFNHESNTQNGQNEITKFIKVPVPVPVPLHVPCPDVKTNDYNVRETPTKLQFSSSIPNVMQTIPGPPSSQPTSSIYQYQLENVPPQQQQMIYQSSDHHHSLPLHQMQIHPLHLTSYHIPQVQMDSDTQMPVVQIPVYLRVKNHDHHYQHSNQIRLPERNVHQLTNESQKWIQESKSMSTFVNPQTGLEIGQSSSSIDNGNGFSKSITKGLNEGLVDGFGKKFSKRIKELGKGFGSLIGNKLNKKVSHVVKNAESRQTPLIMKPEDHKVELPSNNIVSQDEFKQHFVLNGFDFIPKQDHLQIHHELNGNWHMNLQDNKFNELNYIKPIDNQHLNFGQFAFEDYDLKSPQMDLIENEKLL